MPYALLDDRTHRPIAGQGHAERYTLGRQLTQGLQQHELALLLRQPADAYQLRGVGDWLRAAARARGIDAAADDVDFRPVGVGTPAEQLAAAELADRHDERRRLDLVAQRDRLGSVEFLRPVDREAVRRTAQDARQEGH